MFNVLKKLSPKTIYNIHMLNGILTHNPSTFQKVNYQADSFMCISVGVLYLNAVKTKFNQC